MLPEKVKMTAEESGCQVLGHRPNWRTLLCNHETMPARFIPAFMPISIPYYPVETIRDSV